MRIHLHRSSHWRCSIERGVLENFAKFTGKHLCQSLFIKKGLWHRCFPVNFAKFLRAHFLQNTSGRLLLPVSLKWSLTPFTTFLLPCLPNKVFLDVVLLNNVCLTLFDHKKNNPSFVYWQSTSWVQQAKYLLQAHSLSGMNTGHYF